MVAGSGSGSFCFKFKSAATLDKFTESTLNYI